MCAPPKKKKNVHKTYKKLRENVSIAETWAIGIYVTDGRIYLAIMSDQGMAVGTGGKGGNYPPPPPNILPTKNLRV